MKHALFATLGLAAGLMSSVAAQTPAAPAAPVPVTPAPVAPAHHGNRVSGKVTAVDTATQTVTIQERNSTTTTTFTLGPEVKVTKLVRADVGDIKTTDTIQINGPTTGSTVDAHNITVLPEAPKGPPHGRNIIGTVVTTTPTLTVKGLDGTTYTVTTTNRTRVDTSTVGTAADITVDENVNARVHDRDGKSVASEVTIQPARPPRAARLHFGAKAASVH